MIKTKQLNIISTEVSSPPQTLFSVYTTNLDEPRFPTKVLVLTSCLQVQGCQSQSSILLDLHSLSLVISRSLFFMTLTYLERTGYLFFMASLKWVSVINSSDQTELCTLSAEI